VTAQKEYKFEEESLPTRTRIMNAALVLFITYGFDKTTTDKIAKRAGVSAGLMYNYFKSKNELIHEMVHQAMVMAERGLEKVSEIKDPISFLKRSVTGLSSIRAEEDTLIPKLIQLVQVQSESYPEAAEIIRNFHKKVTDVLADKFIELGSTNPRLDAMLLQATTTGIRNEYFLLGDSYPLKEMIDITIKKLLPLA